MANAVLKEIAPGVHVRVVSSEYFCATKLEAFAGRGEGDYYASHDLEDLIAVIDGREEILEEVRAADADVRSYISSEIESLLVSKGFMDALPGHLPPDAASQERLPDLIRRLEELSSL